MRSLGRWLPGAAALLVVMLTMVLAGLPKSSSQDLGAVEDPAIPPVLVAPGSEPSTSRGDLVNLLRRRVKYVFVVYQENRSYDSYFGTFPGADGIFSQPADRTPGFYQPIVNTDGSVGLIHPFRIGPEQFAADTDDIDHSHSRIVAKMDVVGGASLMDKFAVVEELKYSPQGNPSLKAKQFGQLAMAYEDCDTIPIMWRYANRFVLFDHIFQSITGPSTPGNLAIIAAQTGETQWVKHPDQAYRGSGDSGTGMPDLNDADPLWGSQDDPTPPARRMPVNPSDFRGNPPKEYATQINLTFGSLPLTLQGQNLRQVASEDRDARGDLDDVRNDIAAISAAGHATVPWGWYEEGYDHEPTDPGPVDAMGQHASYIAHHNGPQYFGYVANNPRMAAHLHGLDDLWNAIDRRTLPREGGLFYVKGGYQNIMKLAPTDPDPAVRKNFIGDDDHPAYADAQISEAMVAQTINKIARSPYWRQSAIVITWDDSEGDYDHVPPPITKRGPDGGIVSNGPRVPLIVISPFARAHAIAHAAGNHASVVKFADTLFNLTPLAQLPDEQAARALGKQLYNQDHLGPDDAFTPGVDDLLGAFDPARLTGRAAPLPAAYAEIPDQDVMRLPAASGMSCRSIGIVPTDVRLGIRNEIPADFNPRPNTNPSR
ncbi:MAG TPA: alkaline phosphatase family protein [bacterium]|nr:alkaline phosphatase family protein [bacterium]